jgi:hypothetical protein
MKKLIFFKAFTSIGVMFYWICLSGCLQFSGFQTAKTVPKGQSEMGFSGGIASTVKDFDPNIDGQQSVGFPVGELWGRYGIGKKVDLGFKISTLFNAYADSKIMILGDEESKFAFGMGLGLGLQYFAVVTAYQLHIPAYISVHPSPSFAIYASPRYVKQFFANNKVYEGGPIDYTGMSAGLEVGKNVRFGLDFTYFNVIDKTQATDIPNYFQLGAGIKLRFGDSYR